MAVNLNKTLNRSIKKPYTLNFDLVKWSRQMTEVDNELSKQEAVVSAALNNKIQLKNKRALLIREGNLN